MLQPLLPSSCVCSWIRINVRSSRFMHVFVLHLLTLKCLLPSGLNECTPEALWSYEPVVIFKKRKPLRHSTLFPEWPRHIVWQLCVRWHPPLTRRQTSLRASVWSSRPRRVVRAWSSSPRVLITSASVERRRCSCLKACRVTSSPDILT